MTYPRAVFRDAFSLIFGTMTPYPIQTGTQSRLTGLILDYFKTRGTFAPLAKKGRVKMNFLQSNFSLLSKTSQLLLLLLKVAQSLVVQPIRVQLIVAQPMIAQLIILQP